MTDLATLDTEQNTNSDLENLDKVLSSLIENHQRLKYEKEQLEHDYYTLKQHHQSLLNKHTKIEQRIQALLQRLVELDI